jgi:hypothetical protein
MMPITSSSGRIIGIVENQNKAYLIRDPVTGRIIYVNRIFLPRSRTRSAGEGTGPMARSIGLLPVRPGDRGSVENLSTWAHELRHAADERRGAPRLNPLSAPKPSVALLSQWESVAVTGERVDCEG